MACEGCRRRREWLNKWTKIAYERATGKRADSSAERTTAAQREQTEAINRLAESNVALSDVIIQSLAGDLDEAPEQQTYLSGKPRG